MRWQTIILLLSIFLFGVSMTLIAYFGFYLTEYQNVPLDFLVQHGVAGMDLDTDALHFGTVPPGGVARRSMTVTPVRDARLLVRFRGAAAQFMSVAPNNIMVHEGVPFLLNFTVTIPENTSEGNYTGEARFFFFRW